MSANMHEGLRNYRQYLIRKTQPFYCIYCGIPISAREYENHCSRHHELNSKLCCVWCCGTKSWGSGEKHRHVDHLTFCFNLFYAVGKDLPHPINLSPTCPEVQSFYKHSASIRHLLPPQAFQSIWPPKDLPTPPMTFQHENLNLAASYMQLYLETRYTHDWYHVTVNAIALVSFLRALNHDDGDTRLLEFWCWCDEGRETDHMLRQHRHMIAVSAPPKGRFEQDIWPRVQVRPLPRPNYSCKRLKKIEHPLQFINILECVSKRQSACSGNFMNPSREEKKFYIFKSLPTDYKLPLSTLWPGGVEQLLYMEKFSNASIQRVVENPLIRIGSEWQQKIKDFYKLERGLVIPVEKRFAPTTEVTPYFIHLTRNRKLYFKPSPENETLNQASWLRIQFEGGNSFYDAVGEEIWTPDRTDQIRINDMMPLVQWIEYKESHNNELKRENAELRSENYELRSENAELRNENEELKRKGEDVENDIKNLFT